MAIENTAAKGKAYSELDEREGWEAGYGAHLREQARLREIQAQVARIERKLYEVAQEMRALSVVALTLGGATKAKAS